MLNRNDKFIIALVKDLLYILAINPDSVLSLIIARD